MAGYLLSLGAWPWLPARIPPHWTFGGTADLWLGRPFIALLLPTVALGVCLVYRRLAERDPLRANYGIFRPTFDLVLNAGVAFVVAIHATLLAVIVFGPVPWLGRVPPILIGLTLVVIGNVLPRVRPNLALGIRTRWTLASETVWARTHRLAGYVVVGTGAAVLVSTFAAPAWLVPVVTVGVIASVAVPAVASFLFSRALLVLLVAFAGFISTSASQGVPPSRAPVAFGREAFPTLSGPYLGQPPPGRDALRFAPGIVSTPALDAPPVFSPDGREVYWTRLGPGGALLASHLEDGRWTFPERASFAPAGAANVAPCLFDHGRRLLFLSTRALPDGRRPQPGGFFTFWITAREGSGWGAPTPIPSVFTGLEDFSTIADNGTLYLVRNRGARGIERFTPVDGEYTAGRALAPEIKGFPTVVGPGEEYLIVSAELPGGYGGRDLHILFRKPDGTWTPPINMGPGVNSPAIEALASVSPDGKYFFFASERSGDFDVYWMDAGIIAELKKTSAR